MSAHRVREVLCDRFDDGDRTAVLVVGSGLKRAALTMSAEENTRAADDWSSLLARLSSTLGIPELPKSLLMQWETIVRHLARHRDISAHVAESTLKALMKESLSRPIASPSSTTSMAGGAPDELHRVILDLGMRDVVSLNFTPDFTEASDGSWWRANANGDDDTDDRHARTFGAHAVVSRANGLSRVWHPHGHLDDLDSVKMGVDAYAKHITRLDGAFGMFKRRERMARAVNDDTRRKRFLEDRRALDQATLTWPELFFTAPLIFVGCGLSLDEWEVWWLLHQRARNALRRVQKPATLVLNGGPIPTHLRGAPAEIEVLTFSSHDAMWTALLDGVDHSA